MALHETLAAATKPTVNIWGPVGIGMLVAFVGLCVLSLGVSRSKKTGKQSVRMTIGGLVLALGGIAFAYSFRK